MKRPRGIGVPRGQRTSPLTGDSMKSLRDKQFRHQLEVLLTRAVAGTKSPQERAELAATLRAAAREVGRLRGIIDGGQGFPASFLSIAEAA